MRTRRSATLPLRVVALVLLTALAFTACGDDSGDGGSVDEPETTGGGEGERTPEQSDLMVGIIPIANLTPLYVAQEEGFFEERGLNVETTAGTGGSALTAALQGGSLDLAYTAYTTVFQAVPAGFDLRIVAHQNSAQEESPDGSAVITSADSDIESVSDLEGARIAINALNNVNYLTVRAYLDENGVDSDSVEFVEVPFPSMGDALARGDVDAANQVEPFNTILDNQGGIRVIGYQFVETRPGLDIAGFVADGSFVDENPVTVELFAEALDEANDFLEENAEERTRYVAEFTESDPELVDQIILDRWFTRMADTSDLEFTAELGVRYGLVDEEPDIAALVHPTALE